MEKTLHRFPAPSRSTHPLGQGAVGFSYLSQVLLRHGQNSRFGFLLNTWLPFVQRNTERMCVCWLIVHILAKLSLMGNSIYVNYPGITADFRVLGREEGCFGLGFHPSRCYFPRSALARLYDNANQRWAAPVPRLNFLYIS